MSPDRQALLSLYHDDATALLDRALQAQHEPEGLHVAHAAIVEALADAHTDGREPGVSTTVPDETIAAIEASILQALAELSRHAPCAHGATVAAGVHWLKCEDCGRTVPREHGGQATADRFEAAEVGVVTGLRALLAEVRRLTDANTRLTDLVRERDAANRDADTYSEGVDVSFAPVEIDRAGGE